MDLFSVPSTSSGSATKRASQDGDSFSPFTSKRIKQELAEEDAEEVADEPMTDDDDEIGYTDPGEAIDTSELDLLKPDVTLEKFGIPKNMDRMVSMMIQLDPFLRNKFSDYATTLNIEAMLRSVGHKLIFESLEIYCLYYLPIILYSFSKQLTDAQVRHRQIIMEDPPEAYENAYILKKEEFNSDLDFKITRFRSKQIFDGPMIGDFLCVRTKSQRSVNLEEGFYGDQCYFGLTLTTSTRDPKPDVYAIERIVLESLSEDVRRDQICEESIIRVRSLNALCHSADYQLVIYKLVNCLPHMLQAKGFYGLRKDKYLKHFLSPVMSIKNSGIVIEEALDLPEVYLDTIQKAIDLVGQNDLTSSCFLAVDLDARTHFNDMLEPILKSISNNARYFKTKDTELSPIMVLSKDKGYLVKLLDELLKSGSFGENEVIMDPSNYESEQTTANLIALYESHVASLANDVEARRKGVERHKKCIEFLQKNRSIDDLASNWIADMLRRRREVKKKLLKNAKVILTDLDTLCKDVLYLSTFNDTTIGEQKILCCIVIDAHLFTEPETISLTNFGIKKFILFGDSRSHAPEEEILTPKSLNRSLFHRLHLIDSQSSIKLPNTAFVSFDP